MSRVHTADLGTQYVPSYSSYPQMERDRERASEAEAGEQKTDTFGFGNVPYTTNTCSSTEYILITSLPRLKFYQGRRRRRYVFMRFL